MSALLLIYVTFQIEKSQRDVAWTYSGSGLSLIQFNTQNSTNALRLAEALFNYRINTDESKREELRAAYLQKFDIVWSATVYLKQFNSITEYPDLVKFRNASKETLESLDPLMQPDIVLPEDQRDALMKDAEKGANARISVDLESQTVSSSDGETFSFEVDEFKKHCLMNGLDDIGLTMEKSASIDSFEKQVTADRPWV